MKMFAIEDRVINMDNVLYFYKDEDEDVNEWSAFKICFVFSKDEFLEIGFEVDKDRDTAYEKLMKFVNQENS